MNVEQAIELVEDRDGQFSYDGDTELLEAARVLVAKIKSRYVKPSKQYTSGDTTLSIIGWAKRTGISDKTIYGRLKRGWPVELAVATPSQSDGSKFNGKTLKQHSAESGLSIDTIYQRLCRGWSVADAVTLPLKVNGTR